MRRVTTGVALALAAALWTAPALGADHTYVAGPTPLQYASDSITIDQGDTITFQNKDSSGAKHDVTSDAKTPDGGRLFKSATIDSGKTAPVVGVDYLKAGDYSFYCTVHPDFMKGTLHVTANGTPKTGTPPDTAPPNASIAILDGRIGPVLKRGALRVQLRSDEESRFKLTASSGRTILGTLTAVLKSKSRTAQIPLTKAGRKLLRRSRRLKVRVKAAVNDAANNNSAATATRTLVR